MGYKCGMYSYSESGSRLVHLLRVLLLIVAAVIAVGCEGGEIERSKVPELKKIASETPVYPGFEKTEEKVVLKTGRVLLFVFYRSQSAQFSDVKKYYDEVLPKGGWGPPYQPPPSIFVGEKHWVSYRRKDHVIVVQQDGSEPDNFSIVFEWDPQGS